MASRTEMTGDMLSRRAAWALSGATLLAALAVGLGIAQRAGEGTIAGRAPHVEATAAVAPGSVAQAVPGAPREAATDVASTTYHVYLTDSEPLAAWVQQHYAEINGQRAQAGARPLGVEAHVIDSAVEEVHLQEQLAIARMMSQYVETPVLRVVDLRTP